MILIYPLNLDSLNNLDLPNDILHYIYDTVDEPYDTFELRRDVIRALNLLLLFLQNLHHQLIFTNLEK